MHHVSSPTAEDRCAPWQLQVPPSPGSAALVLLDGGLDSMDRVHCLRGPHLDCGPPGGLIANGGRHEPNVDHNHARDEPVELLQGICSVSAQQ